MTNPIVTIIIATYNRPDVLKFAISSVLRQTIENWKLYIIGDNCDERTGEVVNQFNDSRIRYLNLPDRFGEQSGPNSVGIAISETKYTAFLNHDDVWLPDHLEQGIKVLNQGKFNFYLGGYATTAFVEEKDDITKLYVGNLILNNRSPLDFFRQQLLSYEPASSWVVDTNLLKKIGLWNYYGDLYRYPIEDYVLRAWREGARFYFSDKVTVWYVLTHHQKSAGTTYTRISKEHPLIEEILMTKSCEDVRFMLHQNFKEWSNLSHEKKAVLIGETHFGNKSSKPQTLRDKFYLYRQRLFKRPFIGVLAAYCYKTTGIDLFEIYCKIKGNTKGTSLNRAIIKRTGVIPPKPNKELVIKRVLEEINKN